MKGSGGIASGHGPALDIHRLARRFRRRRDAASTEVIPGVYAFVAKESAHTPDTALRKARSQSVRLRCGIEELVQLIVSSVVECLCGGGRGPGGRYRWQARPEPYTVRHDCQRLACVVRHSSAQASFSSTSAGVEGFPASPSRML